MVDDYDAMLTAVLILVSPVIFALPVSFAWRWWVGIEPEHEHYREKVREVHQGINGRDWPVLSVQQFNFLVNAVEALHDQAFEEEEDF